MLDGHFVEENSENTLLHLTSILGSKDNHFHFCKVDGNRCGRRHTGGISVGREGTGIVNDIVWMETFEFLRRWSDKHVTHEESVVGTGTNDPNPDAETFVPSCEAIHHVDAISRVQIIDGTLAVDSPYLFKQNVSNQSKN